MTHDLCPACAFKLVLGGPNDLEDTTLAPDDALTVTAHGSDGSSPRRPQLVPGDVFGPYRIERLLGRGGMGEVYEAVHLQHQRRVALKVLSRASPNREDRERFLREGQLAASISHPHCVYIFGSEDISGIAAISMELVAGGTLKDRLDRDGPLPWRDAVGVTLQVIAGLQAAEAAGILHRDIKPSNCFVEPDGTVKVGDFGLSISTLARHGDDLEERGSLLGTPAFAPPEQLRGDALDVRSDIYAVGATLFCLLTGAPPFESDSLTELIQRAVNEPPPAASSLRPDLPKGLSDLVSRCLAKVPSERPASYAELSVALEPFGPAAPEPAPVPTRLFAYIFDALILTLLAMPVRTLVFNAQLPYNDLDLRLAEQRYWVLSEAHRAIFEGVLTIVYFGVLEGLFGATVGKAACGLRVLRSDIHRPDFTRALWRAVMFSSTTMLPSVIVRAAIALGVWPARYEWYYLTGAAALGLLTWVLWTVRRPDRAARYELWSGTRTVRARTIPDEALTMSTAISGVRPGRAIGPYRLLDDQRAPDGLVPAFDPVLRRSVWLRMGPIEQRASPERRDLRRPPRVRWLNGGNAGDLWWDAYEAPGGKPFVEAIRDDGSETWSRVRRWLQSLADELSEAHADGTMPPLTLDRLWIDSRQRIRLLDWPARVPLPRVEQERSEHAYDREQPFLADMARAALHGRAVAAWSAPARGPIPLTARELLDRLDADDIGTLDDARREIVAIAHRPTQLSTRLRAGHLALSFMPVALIVVIAIASTAGYVRRQRDRLHSDIVQLAACLRALDAGSLGADDRRAVELYTAGQMWQLIRDPRTWADDVAGRAIPDRHRQIAQSLVAGVRPGLRASAEAGAAVGRITLPWIQPMPLHGLWAQTRIDLQTVTGLLASHTKFFFPVIAMIAIVSVILSGLTGGGLGFRLMGAAVVTSDGIAPSMWHAAWRSLLAWTPALAGCWLLSRPKPNELDAWLGPPMALCVILLAVYVAGAIVALKNSSQGWQDKLADTWIVPR